MALKILPTRIFALGKRSHKSGGSNGESQSEFTVGFAALYTRLRSAHLPFDAAEH